MTWLLTTIQRHVSRRHGNIITLVEDSYTSQQQPCTFIDKDFGEFSMLPVSVIRGAIHPARKLAQKLEVFKTKLHAARGNIITVDEKSFQGLRAKCIFYDKAFGPWRASPANVLAGSSHPTRAGFTRGKKRRHTQEEIERMLFGIWGDTVILGGKYTGMGKKLRFIDKDFGEFFSLPMNVIHKKSGHPQRAVQRREETCMKKRGVRHHTHVPEIGQKFANSRSIISYVNHWKTGEELYCASSWERAVVDHLNEAQIDFLWQPKTFKLPWKTTYRPDLFLCERNLWVEIKGYKRPASMKKWEWFHKTYPNSEMWDGDVLEGMGLLRGGRIA